jgi:hypothetical protein
MLAGASGWAQQSQSPVASAKVSTDLAVTYAIERSQVVPGQNNFWFKGGGADAAVTFRSVLGMSGLGIAASVTGDHASNVAPNLDANKVAYLGGPRYTYTAWLNHAGAANNRRLQVFAQGLFGGVHGFNGLYPATSGATTSAKSMAMQAGGGMNLLFSKRFGVRLFEADYVRTTLPNNGTNTQTDLRISAGVTWHIRRW